MRYGTSHWAVRWWCGSEVVGPRTTVLLIDERRDAARRPKCSSKMGDVALAHGFVCCSLVVMLAVLGARRTTQARGSAGRRLSRVALSPRGLKGAKWQLAVRNARGGDFNGHLGNCPLAHQHHSNFISAQWWI